MTPVTPPPESAVTLYRPVGPAEGWRRYAAPAAPRLVPSSARMPASDSGLPSHEWMLQRKLRVIVRRAGSYHAECCME
jgi:hypothetical protein